MRFEISHRTTYGYRTPVAQSHHLVHLQPRETPSQNVIHHSLLIEPAPVSSTSISDVFGNFASLLRIEDQHTELVVHARSTIEVHAPPVPGLTGGSAWEDVAALDVGTDEQIDISVRQFVCRSRHVPISREIQDFARVSFLPRRPLLAGAMDLTRRIFTEFAFDPKATDISTPVARVSRRAVAFARTSRTSRLQLCVRSVFQRGMSVAT